MKELIESLPTSFPLSAAQLALFEDYVRLLLEWNPRAGLVSKADENASRLIKRHIVESLGLVATNLLSENAAVLDLGSGGGFPGVPLKITRPDLKITLLDSRRMKSLFLQEVVRRLNLEKAEVVCARAESLDESFKSRFDFVVVRAVTNLAKLWQWAIPVLKNGGSLLAQKGGDLDQELKELSSAFPGISVKKVNYPAGWDIDPTRYVVTIKM